MVEKYLEINHQRGKVQQKLGELLYDSRVQSHKALEYFQNAVKFSEKALEANSSLSMGQSNSEQLNSNKISILLILGDSHHKIGRLEIRHFLENKGLNSFEAAPDSYVKMVEELKNPKFNKHFESAIEFYGKVISESSKNIFAHSGKGQTLLGLGELYTNLGLADEAVKILREAITFLDYSLKFANEKILLKVFSFIDKGFIFQKIGECQIKQKLEKEAIESFGQGIKSLDEALNIQPNNFLANLNKGRLLYEQGFLQAKNGLIEDALINLTQSVTSSQQAINVIDADKFVYINKGSALQELSRLNLHNGEESKAQESLKKAIDSYNEALKIDPNDSFANLNKGSALLDLGRLTVKQEPQKAFDIFKQSIMSSNMVPENIDALNNKSAGLSIRGRLQVKMADALTSFEEALAVSNQTIRLSPNNIFAYLNKGNAQQNLGELFRKQGKFEEALNFYQLSIESFKQLHSIPDIYYEAKGLSLQRSGELLVKLNKKQRGCENFRQAGEEYNKALEVNSKNENCRRLVESLNKQVEKFCK